jgi:hypothetical protein
VNQLDRNILNAVESSTWLSNFVRANQTLINIESYTYTTSILGVVAGGNGSAQIPIQSDSDFVCTQITGSVFDVTVGAINNSPFATIQVTDTGSAKTFFSDFTLFSLVFGIAGYPYYQPTPRVLAPQTNILINVNNLNAANTYNFYVAFQGARLYYQS